MTSLNQKNEIYDPIRKKWVEKTPEEAIRQALIQKMTLELGYPLSHLAVEKELSALPNVLIKEQGKIPKRRIDLLVFGKEAHDVKPLLMVECKAVCLNEKFARQVIGYNAFVGAPLVALANGQEIMTGAFDFESETFRFAKGLPHYTSIQALSQR